MAIQEIAESTDEKPKGLSLVCRSKGIGGGGGGVEGPATGASRGKLADAYSSSSPVLDGKVEVEGLCCTDEAPDKEVIDPEEEEVSEKPTFANSLTLLLEVEGSCMRSKGLSERGKLADS